MIRTGVDIGGSGIKAGLVDTGTGELVSERLRVATPAGRDPAGIAGVVRDLVGQLGGEGTVGLGMPAVVTNGQARTAANIDQSWIGTDAATLFTDATGRSCLVANDADVAGVAEMAHGAGKGRAGVVLLLTLGTGIGSALFVDGRLVPNTELGHIEVRGKEGERRAAASVRDAKHLSWADWAARLDEYIDTVERLVWPDLIILGGGVTKQPDKFVPMLNSRAPIAVARFRNNAGIIGAALLAATADADDAAPPKARPRRAAPAPKRGSHAKG